MDAWAQPAMSNVMEKLPEVARLFKQSGSDEVKEKFLFKNARRVFKLTAE